MPLRVGVLVIGALFWDSGNQRPDWRDSRLDAATAQNATAPIRYGRLSQSWGNSYTMVYSRLCPSGQGKIIPCSRPVWTMQDLIVEAEHLWKAENPRANAHRICARWGCVTLLCNPERAIPTAIVNGWAARVREEPDYGSILQGEGEGILVDPAEGLLRIDWPKVGEATADFDLLLATAIKPTLDPLSGYPSTSLIAEAWNKAGPNVEYFLNNRANGIRTFQDEQIGKLLNV